MTRIIRLMFLEALAFAAASLVHSGALIAGYEHAKARVAEGIIAVVLVLGSAWALLQPKRARQAGLVAQTFALVGTLVGVFTIAVGVGPRTIPDVAFHLGILLVLGWGLADTARLTKACNLQHAQRQHSSVSPRGPHREQA